MIPFVDLPASIQGTIGLYIVLLFFSTGLILIQEIYHRYYKHVSGLALLLVVLYVMFQCICDTCSHMRAIVPVLRITNELFEQIPTMILVLFLMAITVLEVGINSQIQTWKKANISPASIKEAIDDLPVGICCYEPNGQVMMKNNRMEALCREYTGESLLNAVAFRNVLYAEQDQTDRDVILPLTDGTVVSVSDNTFSEEEPLLRIMMAADITEQYKNTQTLAKQQELVATLNKELSEYGKQIVSSTTAKEVLNAKVKLHDELGANLLAIKRYILNGGTTEERIAIENILYKNLQYLKNETGVQEKDEYAVILDTAAKLDIKITIVGELTESEAQRHVIVTGIHECLTNTIRHAGGDELTVVLEEEDTMLIAHFTNNGKAPEKEINERGGLAMLRALTEECGGSMQILTRPGFELILKLPKEEIGRGL